MDAVLSKPWKRHVCSLGDGEVHSHICLGSGYGVEFAGHGKIRGKSQIPQQPFSVSGSNVNSGNKVQALFLQDSPTYRLAHLSQGSDHSNLQCHGVNLTGCIIGQLGTEGNRRTDNTTERETGVYKVRAMTRPPSPPIPRQADELTMLNAFLDYYRDALLDRAWGLDQTQLATPLAPSTLTIGGLITHMAMVEYNWYRSRFAGGEQHEAFTSLDWDTDRDAEMSLAATMTVDELHQLFEAAVSDSRKHVANASSLDQVSVKDQNGDGEKWNLRWIMIHMIEEYARHCGHADLIRESIDGDVCGND